MRRLKQRLERGAPAEQEPAVGLAVRVGVAMVAAALAALGAGHVAGAGAAAADGTVGPVAGAKAAAAQSGPKIYISADLEGVAGAVTAEQLGPGGFEYERFRRFMTEEVLAAIAGARSAGAGEILVSDSHGNGQNLLIDELPDDIEVIRSWPRPLSMMEGIDESFDGAIFIGYHSGTTWPTGVRAHTMSSARLADVRINGRSVPEAGWNAAVAAHFGVPVIMISGDEAAVEEAGLIVGDVEAAVVKRSISFHSARTLTPSAARELIRTTAERAVSRIGDFTPWEPDTPVAVEVRFKNYRPSQILAYLPLFERLDAHAVRFEAADMVEAARTLTFILNFEAGLEP